VPNPHDPTSAGGKGYSKSGVFVWLLWVAFLVGSIASTFMSLLSLFLSYGSLEIQYRECMVEMPSGDAFLNVVAPVFPFLPPVVAKIAALAGNVFVLLEGIGVFTSLGTKKIRKLLTWLVGVPIVAPLGVIAIGYFYVTLGWIFSGLFFVPIPLVLGLVGVGAWLAVVRSMAWVKGRADAVAAVKSRGDSSRALAIRAGVLSSASDVAQTSLWWLSEEDGGAEFETWGILVYTTTALHATMWPIGLVALGLACAGVKVKDKDGNPVKITTGEDGDPLAFMMHQTIRILKTIAKANPMTTLAACGFAALFAGPFVTFSTWTAFFAYQGDGAGALGGFVGDCYAAAFDFTAVGLPAFSFDFSAVWDLDVSLATIPKFDVVSPTDVNAAGTALDAAALLFAILKVLVTVASYVLSFQAAFGDNVAISTVAGGQANIGAIVRACDNWPALMAAMNGAYGEDIVTEVPVPEGVKDNGNPYYSFVLRKEGYPGILQVADFKEGLDLSRLVVFRAPGELKGDLEVLLGRCGAALRELDVHGCEELVGGEFGIFSGFCFGDLKVLNVSDCKEIDCSHALELLPKMPWANGINELDLSYTNTAGSVLALEHMPAIRACDLSGTKISCELSGAVIKLISECDTVKFDGCKGSFTLPATLGDVVDAIMKVDLSSLGAALSGDVSVFSQATEVESFNVSGTKVSGDLSSIAIKLISEGKANFDGCIGPFTLPATMRGMNAAELKSKHGFSNALLCALRFPVKELKDECGFTLKEVLDSGVFSDASEIMAAFNLKKGHQFVFFDRSNTKGQVVYCEGKVGTITSANFADSCRISYSDGSTNKDMTTTSSWEGGDLRFVNRDGDKERPVEPVWAME
jgi:hypothetical protein